MRALPSGKLSAAPEREKPNVYRLLTDEALGRALLDLERQVDNCDRMQEPQASSERQRVLEQLDRVRLEVERRHA